MRLAVALFFALTAQALAQQAPEPSETTETFGSWTVRCVAQQGSETKACEVVLAISGQSGLIAQIAFGRPEGSEGTVLAVRTPLGVLVSSPVVIAAQSDGASPVNVPFVTCLATGCLAQAQVAAQPLGDLAAAETAAIEFAERSGRKVRINIPLSGLKDALTRIGLDCSNGPCEPAD